MPPGGAVRRRRLLSLTSAPLAPAPSISTRARLAQVRSQPRPQSRWTLGGHLRRVGANGRERSHRPQRVGPTAVHRAAARQALERAPPPPALPPVAVPRASLGAPSCLAPQDRRSPDDLARPPTLPRRSTYSPPSESRRRRRRQARKARCRVLASPAHVGQAQRRSPAHVGPCCRSPAHEEARSGSPPREEARRHLRVESALNLPGRVEEEGRRLTRLSSGMSDTPPDMALDCDE